ncbi:c2H2-type zinc-finger domain-containing protein [Rutstroemia sp. NJR-2017a BBW]|nr:c2H2-type zinc-finger domain-containing protein [Rutstroemia sp. NJR-2017a BBW]
MEPFVHFLAQGVIICSECKYAVLPSHIDTHLKDKEKHRAMNIDREHMVAAIQTIQGLKTTIAELNQLIFPPVSNPPIPILQQAWTDGLRCQLHDEDSNPYMYIAYQVRKIQEHCRQVHQWENPQKKGRLEVWREIPVP